MADPTPYLPGVLARFLLYGCVGWVMEVLFTGTGAALQRDRHATAKTFLWMHPIYGLTALALERLQHVLTARGASRWTRGLAYTGVIYMAEYGSGWALKRVLGRCPWDYSPARFSVHGLVRLDYAPAWYAAGLLFEPVRDAVLRLTAEATAHAPDRPAAANAALAEAVLGPSAAVAAAAHLTPLVADAEAEAKAARYAQAQAERSARAAAEPAPAAP